MIEARRRLIQGAIVGSFMGAGVVLVMFWHILTSATNAGALVDGVFRPYQAMPEWRILLVGGLLFVVVGVAALAVMLRAPPGESP